MADKAEASFAKDYRNARRAFIAACEHAHGDSIARVHPTALGPDGKPLFIDCVALGSRDAQKALLVITGSRGEDGLLGSQILVSLLDSQVLPLSGTRLVLVHALNPFGFAWRQQANEDGLALDDPKAGQSWSLAMLRAIATEDLARVQKLRILDVAEGPAGEVTAAPDCGPARALRKSRPRIDLIAARLLLQPDHAGGLTESVLAKSVVERALATL
ncbi:MAG TPA: DUF2817 domain-containing protein [Rhizomicrobium sp.]|nr:DUF2817 domain-containing protein [Rhizomicrobium sp.]